VKNSKVGIPIAHRATAGELAARYSTVSLNSDVVTGILESITGAQLAPERLAAVHIQNRDVNKTEFGGGTVQAGQRFETLAVRAGLLGDDRLTVDISVRSTSSRLAAVNRKFLNPDDALVDVVDATVGADFDKDLAHRG
jgi:hypothetical protein